MFTKALMNKALNSIAIVAGEARHYGSSWGSDFSMKNLNRMFDAIPEKFTIEDFKSLSVEDLLSFGFRHRIAAASNEFLLPLWLFDFIDPKCVYTCIDGTTATKAEMDNDSRGGCLAYYFTK